MTKDEMRTAALEANNENDHIYYRNGFLHGFNAGYDTAMSRTCEWMRMGRTITGVKTSCGRLDVYRGRDFCPNCGGKIVPPDSGEEKNDE